MTPRPKPTKGWRIVGAHVKARRLAHGWSRPEFARRSGVSVSYLKLIEGQPPADRNWPSERILKDLTRALKCTREDLVVFDDDTEPVAA